MSDAGGTSGGTLGRNNEAIDNEESTAGQSRRPDGVGGTHERTESASGRSNTDGIDLRIPIENDETPEQPSDGTAENEGFFNAPVQESTTETITQSIRNAHFAQPTIFSFPTEAEQIAEINARMEDENAKRPVIITAEDIESALIAWNGDVESKARVYQQMTSGDNAREYLTAAFLKNEFGNNRDLFSVTKDGAMPFEISWENVQFRINQLIDNGNFLTPQDWAFIKAQEQTQQQAPAPEAEKSPGLPITKGIARAFRGHDNVLFAHDKDGSLYISNGYFIAKTAENDITAVLEQINKGKRGTKLEAIERPNILEYLEKAQGNFELTAPPHVLENEGKNALKSYVYADEKQYFQYDGNYVDAFQSAAGSTARLFVDDGASYDTNSHNMIFKSPNNEVLGLILPVRTDEEFYQRMANVIPLEIPHKSEYERIKENPTNDPYIGKEYTDGANTYIVARLRTFQGEDIYEIPTVKDGVVSRSADIVKPEDMENCIAQWDSRREANERYRAEAEVKAQLAAEARAIYENTHGFADNFPPMQKARVLSTLDKSFNTKDYGNLNTKTFIETAVKDGKTLQAVPMLKQKYQNADYSIHDYARKHLHNNYERIQIDKARVVLKESRDENSEEAQMLKENHPFLHYDIFRDISVLPQEYFTMNYRLMTGENEFFNINKTAFDYGNFLIDNEIFPPQPTAEKLLNIDGADYYLFHMPENAEKHVWLSVDTLSLLKEKADKYVVCADALALSDEKMTRGNIEFRKMPRDFGTLPFAVQERIAEIRPDFAESFDWDKNSKIETVSNVFGADKKLLFELIDDKATTRNINEFGRFDRLIDSVDRAKAKAHFEKTEGASLSEFQTNIKIYASLQNFVLKGKFDVPAELPQPTATIGEVNSEIDASGLREQISNNLLERGFVVSEELIEAGISDYDSHGEKITAEIIADFIESEYLTEEPEPAANLENVSWEDFVSDTRKNVADYAEPFVLIEFSESERFSDFERLSFPQADAKFKEVESVELAERAEEGRYGGYHKTSGMIFYKADPSDTELSTYEFRYDIGDYDGEKSGLYNHINNRCNNIDDALNGRNAQLENSVKAMKYTQETVESIRNMLNICQPPPQELTSQVEAAQPITEATSQPFPKLGKGSVLPENTGDSEVWYEVGDTVFFNNSSHEITAIAEDSGVVTTRDPSGGLRYDSPQMFDALLLTNNRNQELRDEKAKNASEIGENNKNPRFEIRNTSDVLEENYIIFDHETQDYYRDEHGNIPKFFTAAEVQNYLSEITEKFAPKETPEIPTPQSTPEQPQKKEAAPEPFPKLGKGSKMPENTGDSEVSEPQEQPPQPPGTNFRITDPHLGEGGAKRKYAFNIEAIRTLQTIEAENRTATPEEQETLSRYVGWGGIQE
ncbi:MAG: hypothetical protein FWF79_01015, partial [Defluviitaleaceae bacterium]|nr:hypothetical protein [Defluviitaleaceae bacterium]